jgi:hypothetical protein
MGGTLQFRYQSLSSVCLPVSLYIFVTFSSSLEADNSSVRRLSAFYGNGRFSLTCPQEPTTGKYPEPDEPGPYPDILFLYDQF